MRRRVDLQNRRADNQQLLVHLHQLEVAQSAAKLALDNALHVRDAARTVCEAWLPVQSALNMRSQVQAAQQQQNAILAALHVKGPTLYGLQQLKNALAPKRYTTLLGFLDEVGFMSQLERCYSVALGLACTLSDTWLID